MKRRPPGFLLSKAITGFLQYKAATALSPRTVEGYDHDLKKWLAYTGDKEVANITTQDLRAYLVWLSTGYKPRRFNGETHPL
ncbi:MAG: site-specific integrase [Chloroflexota bacterium]